MIEQTEPVVKTKRRTTAKRKPKLLPPHSVVVLNDNVHTFQYVIETFIKVLGINLEKAFQLTEEIHRSGRGIVWTGPIEVAELKRDQLRGAGPDFYADPKVESPLGVLVEPLPG